MKALFPGTFNPPTKGHRDIIFRAAALFEKLYLGIGVNTKKKSLLFNFEERKAMLETIAKPLMNVEVITFSGLVIDCVKQYEIDVMIRGLRCSDDFYSEQEMAHANLAMAGVETLFLMAHPNYVNISASLVKEIGQFGHDLSAFVPEEIADIVSQKLLE